MLALLTLVTTALAADAIELEVISKGQEGQSLPALIVVANVAVDRLDVKVDCGGASATLGGGADPGARLRMDLSPLPGITNCTGSLSATFADGGSGEMPLSFQVQVLPPMTLEVPHDRVDLAAGRLQVRADRDTTAIKVEAFGLDGGRIGSGEGPGGAAGQLVGASWSPTASEVLRLTITATDSSGFWSAQEVCPWYYEIPHEDVAFDTGKWAVQHIETPKLVSAKSEIDAVLVKYSQSDVVMKLYVAGYTDRVGSAESNMMLSRRRAEAIADWFVQAGFGGEVWYQGFGETGNLIATADEVAEPHNRRAAYVVSAQPPPRSAQMPAGDWKRLR